MTRTASILLISLILAASAIQADPVDPVGDGKGDSKLVFKADKELIGGTIHLFLPDGQLIASQRIRKRKVVIDFTNASFGEYRIVMASGDKRQVLYYLKK